MARTQGATLWELRAALRLASSLAGQDRGEASSLLIEVLNRMPAGSGAVEVGQARLLLDGLRQ